MSGRSQFLRETYNTPLGREIEVCITPPHQFALSQQQHLLPGWKARISYVILVLQKSSISLEESSIKVAQEKNHLRENFIRFGCSLIFLLRDQGYPSDLFDPRTGYPLLASPEIPWDDNAAIKALLNYPVINYQHCSLLRHPIWQNHVYPSTIVTSAPLELINSCWKRIVADHDWTLNG